MRERIGYTVFIISVLGILALALILSLHALGFTSIPIGLAFALAKPLALPAALLAIIVRCLFPKRN
jgi:hypothetical protein